ncbi:MAG: hypothetical protein UR28_C0001G0078 [Candidatus Peregrinibacteria bacterium GW2011_GWF2_33_10]|nr:MAG: hypothetical protein UR28_C0001G0078 [Candidatus Peregrinibacteria bacterium GW2011_GWF2_33_10]OGJ44823.1 MAG: hypothetical protein A2263_06320 [Candidatus Peregrinibacteria bacterium RIFOXYA2_FULL_33_21]OGJ47109.1 MAG: hypothetical protein A2272_03040 [Candidatus Peregrinibacteria bacterium RIFOXYA12_FULL_33_12]OGJ50509.1 MAG: hypothetical protein A2307_02945 [Candidatus Peregrinibacteria bacterium RIFOXYB2_FULL_33_20]
MSPILNPKPHYPTSAEEGILKRRGLSAFEKETGQGPLEQIFNRYKELIFSDLRGLKLRATPKLEPQIAILRFDLARAMFCLSDRRIVFNVDVFLTIQDIYDQIISLNLSNKSLAAHMKMVKKIIEQLLGDEVMFQKVPGINEESSNPMFMISSRIKVLNMAA